MRAAPGTLLWNVQRSSWRFAIPNSVTLARIALGIVATMTLLPQPHLLAWWILAFALLDLLDGALARLVRATSRVGARLDSAADFINFGVLPAMLILAALRAPDFAARGTSAEIWSEGPGYVAATLACGAYAFAAGVRLLRHGTRPPNTSTTPQRAGTSEPSDFDREHPCAADDGARPNAHAPEPSEVVSGSDARRGAAPALFGLPAPVAAITIALTYLSGPNAIHALAVACLPPLSLVLALGMLGTYAIRRPVAAPRLWQRLAQLLMLFTIVGCVLLRSYPEVLALLLVGWYAGVLARAIAPRPRHVISR